MAVAETSTTHEDTHGHHGPEYLAHHFHNTEQQYDAGKLGIWIFLVTEVLFFSGLFVAYTLYRYHHPEIFSEASNYLDTAMGAINTIVLLFSSLTMAWAVRCAQIENRKGLVYTVLITLFCAAIFLGIKAVEYTHKWDLGIFVREYFNYHATDHHGPSEYLFWVSLPFAIAVAVFGVLAVVAMVKGSKLWSTFLVMLCFGVLGYFLGVGVGLAYEPIKASIVGEEDHATAEHGGSAAAHGEDSHAGTADEQHAAEAEKAAVAQDTPQADSSDAAEGITATESEVDRKVGVFFSIYYFMTGLHGFHVLGGMVALSWILFRSLRGDFFKDYFGPVDNVGLYWHLVDLIWIYLFPLLYLIGN